MASKRPPRPRSDDATEPSPPTEPTQPTDVGEFAKVPEKMLRELIQKGRQDAEELDRVIRSQFEVNADDGPDFK